MVRKTIEKNSKGSIVSTEGIEFDVLNPQGGHRQKFHKEVYARDELERNQ